MVGEARFFRVEVVFHAVDGDADTAEVAALQPLTEFFAGESVGALCWRVVLAGSPAEALAREAGQLGGLLCL